MYGYYEYTIETTHIDTGKLVPLYFRAMKSKDNNILVLVRSSYFSDKKPYVFKVDAEKIRTWDDFEAFCNKIIEGFGCELLRKKWSWDVKMA